MTPVSKVEDVATPGGIVLSAVSDDQAIRHNIEALSLGLKDVRLMLQQAEAVDCPLPIVQLAETHLLLAQQAGWEQLDWSVLGRVIDRAAYHQPLRDLAAKGTAQ